MHNEEIVEGGGKTVWGEPSAIGTGLEGLTFDVVLDNNGKDLDTVKPVVDWAKSSGAGQFLFISSAGIYKQTEELPLVEGDIVKADARHFAILMDEQGKKLQLPPYRRLLKTKKVQSFQCISVWCDCS